MRRGILTSAPLASRRAFRIDNRNKSGTMGASVFVGHYSVASALKSEQNRIPLWVLFVAVMFLDYVWATFVLLGIEKLRIVPGFTAGSPLDAYYMPYSHSLVAAVTWAIGIAAIYWWRVAVSRRDACVLALVILSHWFLDLIAHPPDLAL